MKEFGFFQTALWRISSRGTPWNKAQEAATPLTSCARGVPGPVREEGLKEMVSTIHLEIDEREARLWGAWWVRKRAFSPEADRKPLVFSMYQRSARTGHHTLSSETEEKVEIFGKKMGWGRKSIVWFLARKEGSGTRRTPWGRKVIWPGAVERAWSAPLLRPEAKLMRNTVFKVICLRELLWRGSKGGPARVSKTEERLHGGTKARTVGRFKNIPLIRWLRETDSEMEPPSWKPGWMAAIAERYPLIVLTFLPNLNRYKRKSAIWPIEASDGPIERPEHHSPKSRSRRL